MPAKCAETTAIAREKATVMAATDISQITPVCSSIWDLWMTLPAAIFSAIYATRPISTVKQSAKSISKVSILSLRLRMLLLKRCSADSRISTTTGVRYVLKTQATHLEEKAVGKNAVGHSGTVMETARSVKEVSANPRGNAVKRAAGSSRTYSIKKPWQLNLPRFFYAT